MLFVLKTNDKSDSEGIFFFAEGFYTAYYSLIYLHVLFVRQPYAVKNKKIEQRCNLKFLVKLKKNSKETYELLIIVYGENVMT